MSPLARCPEPGCAWRYRTGPDRLCPDHAGDTGSGSAAAAIFTAGQTVPDRKSHHLWQADDEKVIT